MRKIIIGVIMAAVIPLAACSSGPGTITSHGALTAFASPLSGLSVTDSYPDITSGGQVTITNAAGKVIGTSSLTFDVATTRKAEKLFATTIGSGTSPADYSERVEAFTFTVRVPGGLPRNGIQVGRDRGTVWFSPAQMSKGPVLTLGSAAG